MAADTREDTAKPSSTPSKSSTETKKLDPQADSDARSNATVLATGKDVGVVDILKTVRLSDAMELHKTPCVRESLLTGIGGGFGLGGIRAIWGGKRLSALACSEPRG